MADASGPPVAAPSPDLISGPHRDALIAAGAGFADFELAIPASEDVPLDVWRVLDPSVLALLPERRKPKRPASVLDAAQKLGPLPPSWTEPGPYDAGANRPQPTLTEEIARLRGAVEALGIAVHAVGTATTLSSSPTPTRSDAIIAAETRTRLQRLGRIEEDVRSLIRKLSASPHPYLVDIGWVTERLKDILRGEP